MIGLVAPSLVIGVVIHLLNQAYGFGSPSLPAPQATLLAIVGSGIIHQELPMALIFLGVVLGVIILLLRIRVLPFAIGLYLPLEITTAIFIGGVVRFLVAAKKVDESPGILAGSGLVAGNACVGVIIALLSVLGLISQKVSLVSPLFSLAAFLFLTSLFLFLSLKSNPS